MNAEIADRLARKRKEHGLSQEELAQKLGVSRQAVSKWERSESSPDTDNLIAIAQLYSVSLDDLIYSDEESEPASAQPVPPEEPAGASTSDDSKGDEVHVGWNGIHVKSAEKGDEVHVGWDGIHVTEGGKTVVEGPTGPGGKEGVEVNGEHYDSWHEAHAAANEANGRKKEKTASQTFPIAIAIVIAYLLAGMYWDAWGTAWIFFLIIPYYYMVVGRFARYRVAGILIGIYAIAAMVWFFWMALALNQPNPAWVIFLTIPLVDWLIVWICRSCDAKKK